jgi:hypothetical protein
MLIALRDVAIRLSSLLRELRVHRARPIFSAAIALKFWRSRGSVIRLSRDAALCHLCERASQRLHATVFIFLGVVEQGMKGCG